ncbi:MAG: DUF4139 domain-containing protein [Candidatus Sumerlaeia bacterium]
MMNTLEPLRCGEARSIRRPAPRFAIRAANRRRTPMPAAGRLAVLMLIAAAGALGAMAPRKAVAKVDLVTLPSRDETQITIYNSEDITLVDEKRLITFKKGRNEIQFSWAGTLIDPTSLTLEFLEHKEDFEILDVTYPANTHNVLIWAVNSTVEAAAPIRISYFLSGLTWSADYTMIASADERTAHIEGFVRVINNSGEDFENTQVRLVVGKINLVEKIADLARRYGWEPERARRAMAAEMKEAVGMADALAAGAPIAAPPEIQKEAISDYFIYTVKVRDDIPTGWSKRLQSFTKDDVPIEVVYKMDARETGNAVIKYYRFHNKKDAGLGEEPLPDGLWNVFIERAGENIFPADYPPLAGRTDVHGLSFLQSVEYKYVPMGEKVDLTLGPDGLITVEERMMRLMRDAVDTDPSGYVIGYDETEDWELEVRNSKAVSVPVEIVRWFQGDYELTSNAPKTQENQWSWKFVVQAPARDKSTIAYSVKTHKGSNAKK